MRVIGLCGPEGAGKSTVARMLAKEGYAVVPFAKPLKDMLRAIGVPEACLTGTPEQKTSPLDLFGGKSARHAMQTLGTEWGRQCIAPDFWARAWTQHVRDLSWSVDVGIVSDDVRFPQEVEAIRKLGGRIVCVVRSMNDFKRVSKHPSEDFAALRPDIICMNDGPLSDLQRKVYAGFECCEV